MSLSLYRKKENSSHGFHLFQEGLFPFLPDSSLLPVFFPRFSPVFLSSKIKLAVPHNLSRYSIDGFFKVRFFQLTLPYNDDAPAFCLQFPPNFLIPLLVPGNLGHPKLGIGFGDRIILTVFVAVPEAPMYENNCVILWENNIRSSRQAFVIHSIAKTTAP